VSEHYQWRRRYSLWPSLIVALGAFEVGVVFAIALALLWRALGQ
jgi:hypothetical protein